MVLNADTRTCLCKLFVPWCVWWHGSVHDSRVLANYSLYNEIACNHILPNRTMSIAGVDVPLYMIEDSANTVLNEQQWNYNYRYRVCRARFASDQKLVLSKVAAFAETQWHACSEHSQCHNCCANVLLACCIISVRSTKHFNDTWLQYWMPSFQQNQQNRDTSTGPV